ncbi:MAG: M55 family metallopeptidase [Clostridia bacterium]|nr:M55 family metallopeptidase [Clostridia bacterium]MBO7548679.1 M55 family metallopeptidase [Clostridia bacterium]MBP5238410.1 M55 family metallopeptidase [Clostridia bacterium]MBP5658272.1 M55 family metallopeptidase [Clostridia bacterium]MBP5754762.1 M55 family metallopeptidase [Clostridia bacterium]
MFKNGGRFYISVDLEGLACVIGEYGKGLGFDTPGYAYARGEATEEVNAAVKALYDRGASEVWVWDSHGKGYNLLYDKLDPRTRIVMGAGSKKRFPLIETGFDGVLFIGYHGYDVPNAVLAHVYSSLTYQYMRVNGKDVGEAQIDGAIAGKYGVPVIFLSSDDICVSQAKESFPGAKTVVTKRSLAWNSCVSEHPETVKKAIYAAVCDAADAIAPEPFVFGSPFEYEIRYKRIEYAESCALRSFDNKPFERVDAYTVKGTLADPEDILR